MLSSGARRLAESKAVVKSLTDVETLGGTTVINSDKTGTLTMNAMTATTMLAGGEWYQIEGGGYTKTGRDPGRRRRRPVPDFRRLALGPDAVHATPPSPTTESVIGDPTEAAFVVLAAKMGVDAEETRRALPRRAEVPFDSEYKFMATFHDRPDWLTGGDPARSRTSSSVKGAPDVVIDRCSHALWHGEQVPDRRACATSSSPPTSSCPSEGCGCWRSPPATSTTRRCPRRSPTRWRRSPTSSSSRWSGSSTRCAPRPRTPSASRSPPASTCA